MVNDSEESAGTQPRRRNGMEVRSVRGTYNLFGTQNTELHLAHGADGCSRVSERLTCLSAHSESDEEGVALEVEAKRAQ